MTKVVNITNKSQEQIQEMIDRNPAWELVTCGSSERSERHEVKGMRGTVLISDPPEMHYFAIFKEIDSMEAYQEFKTV